VSTEVIVDKLPDCDFKPCSKKATVDGKTTHGPWAYMCPDHFEAFGVGLGTGRGQLLLTESSNS
jgi:hypothetical protein